MQRVETDEGLSDSLPIDVLETMVARRSMWIQLRSKQQLNREEGSALVEG